MGDEVDTKWSDALAALWVKQNKWSRAADARKKAHSGWSWPLTVMGFAGVVLSTISPHLVRVLAPAEQVAGSVTVLQFIAIVLGPAIVAVCAVLTRELLGPKSEQAWIKARTTSEALKAEGYIYASGAPPYLDKLTAPSQLVAKMTELVGTQGDGPLPEADPNAVKNRPHQPLDVDGYVASRVMGQIKYHRDGARENADRLRFWRNVTIVLAVVSALLGVVAGVQKDATLNTWVAVVSTAAATVTAFVFAGRFEFLAGSYFATSERLEDLITHWKVSDHSEGARARFILDCEGTLEAQNRSWRDELSKRVSEKLKQDNPSS